MFWRWKECFSFLKTRSFVVYLSWSFQPSPCLSIISHFKLLISFPWSQRYQTLETFSTDKTRSFCEPAFHQLSYYHQTRTSLQAQPSLKTVLQVHNSFDDVQHTIVNYLFTNCYASVTFIRHEDGMRVHINSRISRNDKQWTSYKFNGTWSSKEDRKRNVSRLQLNFTKLQQNGSTWTMLYPLRISKGTVSPNNCRHGFPPLAKHKNCIGNAREKHKTKLPWIAQKRIGAMAHKTLVTSSLRQISCKRTPE